MKKIIWLPSIVAIICLIAFALIFCMATLSFAAILNLKATWTPNTETDMAGYNLYRTDGTRLKLNPALIPFLTTGVPTAQYLFSLTVPDNSSGTMTFVMTAVDTSGNESLDSNTASKIYDLVPPVKPTGLMISF